MSYILDALRRAEAQRERSGVPDLHAQPQGTGASLPASRAGTAVVWAIFAVLALAALAAAWWLLGRRDAPAVPVRDVVVVAPAVPMPPVAATPPVTAPAAPAVVAPAPAPAAVPAPPSPSPAPAPAAAPAARPPAVAASPRPAAKEARPAAATASRTAAPSAPPAAPAANEPRIYTREELPGDIRGQLPQLKITGSTYSENPSSRMLIANGQIFYENEKIAPDTTLVQIRQTSAILSFRGFRYAVPY